jgi:integrase/recombinase XerC
VYTHNEQEAGNMSEIIRVEQNALTAQELTEATYQRFVSFLDVKEKSTQTYTRNLRQLFKYFGENGIRNPQREDIISFRESLKERGLKPTTVQGYITSARLFFQWTEQERIYPNVAAHIKGAKLDREHKRDYLTSKQGKAVLAGIDRSSLTGLRDYAIVALTMTDALRTIEVSRADIGDLRTLGDMTVLYVQGKGRDEKTEYVKVSEPVEAAIRAYLKARGENDPAAPLFASESNNSKGGRMSTRSISGICKAAMIEAGYNSSRLTAHSLRHTGVTLALLSGESLEAAQQYARHANIATTMIYNHALDKAKNKCNEAVSSALF